MQQKWRAICIKRLNLKEKKRKLVKLCNEQKKLNMKY